MDTVASAQVSQRQINNLNPRLCSRICKHHQVFVKLSSTRFLPLVSIKCHSTLPHIQ